MAIWRTLPGYRMQIGSGQTALLIVPTGTDVPDNRIAEMQAEASARGIYLVAGTVVSPDPETSHPLTRGDGDARYAARPTTGTPSSTTYLRGDGRWATPAGGSGGGGVSNLSELADVSTAGAAVGMVVAVSGTGSTAYKLMDYFKVLVAQLDPLITGTITRDANGAATSAPVVWPDGTAGIYTATTVSTAFPGAVDAYTVTYDPAGTANDRTYTQPAVTRDATGAVTARPAVTVA